MIASYSRMVDSGGVNTPLAAALDLLLPQQREPALLGLWFQSDSRLAFLMASLNVSSRSVPASLQRCNWMT